MLGLAIVLLVAGAIGGCASLRPAVVPVTGTTEVSLGADEGLLLVDIDSALPIGRLTLSHETAASNLSAGEHFFMLIVTAGEHRWNRIVVPTEKGNVVFTMQRSDVWRFRVLPGRINYAGHIRFGGRAMKSSVTISADHRNRSARALRRLREKFPELLEKYPPTYTGSSPDGFLDYYVKTSSSLRANAESTSP